MQSHAISDGRMDSRLSEFSFRDELVFSSAQESFHTLIHKFSYHRDFMKECVLKNSMNEWVNFIFQKVKNWTHTELIFTLFLSQFSLFPNITKYKYPKYKKNMRTMLNDRTFTYNVLSVYSNKYMHCNCFNILLHTSQFKHCKLLHINIIIAAIM